MKGKADFEAAATEAHEEAGLVGVMLPEPIGRYTYWRRTRKDFRLTEVHLYALAVEGQSDDWKEKGQRELRWADVLTAADLVQEPELSTLIVRVPLNEAVVALLRQIFQASPAAP